MTIEISENTAHKLMRDMFTLWCQEEGSDEIKTVIGSRQLAALQQIRQFEKWLKASDWWSEDENPEHRDELFENLLYENFELYDEAYIYAKDKWEHLKEGECDTVVKLWDNTVIELKWRDEFQFVDWGHIESTGVRKEVK